MLSYDKQDRQKEQIMQQMRDRITQHITPYQKGKTIKDSNFILGALKNHFIFYNLSQKQLQNIKQKMLLCDIRQGDIIFQQGQIGHCFFIINKGKVNIECSGNLKKQLSHQNGFGQLALLYNTKRTSTAKAKSDVSLWVIDRYLFRQAVDQIATIQFQQNRKCLQNVAFFNNLTHQQKDIITSALTIQYYSKGQNIIQEGDPGSSFFIIKQGTASLQRNNREIKKLSQGDSFGQQSLYYNTMRLLTVRAQQDVKCLVLGRDNLSRVFNDQVYNITFRNFIKSAINKSPILNRLNKQQIDKVIQIMHINTYKAGQPIYKRGLSVNKIVVVFQGNISKLHSGQIIAKKGQVWGQIFLTNAHKNKAIQEQLILDSDGVIAELPFQHISWCLGGKKIDQVIQQNQRQIEKQMSHLQNKLALCCSDLLLGDLTFVEKVSNNPYGCIYRGSSINLMTQFTIKVFNKKIVNELNIKRHLNNQRNLLSMIGHPFILKMANAYQDNFNYYLLMEQTRGINFLQAIMQIGLLSSNDCKFYISTIILILQYLHYHGIIHRDIKPQNFHINQQGFLKLAQLLTACKLKTKSSHTFTILGTPHYMAPQYHSGKGYSYPVDLWSLGIVLFQLICGYLPYGDDTSNPIQIYQDIINDNVKFPSMLKDKKAKKLIQQLLSRNPERRLGGCFNNLMSHPWLQNFNFNHLIEKNKLLSIPFFPKHNPRKTDQCKGTFKSLNIVDEVKFWPKQ